MKQIPITLNFITNTGTEISTSLNGEYSLEENHTAVQIDYKDNQAIEKFRLVIYIENNADANTVRGLLRSGINYLMDNPGYQYSIKIISAQYSENTLNFIKSSLLSEQEERLNKLSKNFTEEYVKGLTLEIVTLPPSNSPAPQIKRCTIV